MANKSQYLLEETGRLIRQTISEQEIDLKPEILQRFVQHQLIKFPGLFSAATISPKLSGTVGMANKGPTTVFSIRLNKLPLRARFVVRGEYLVPDFTSNSTPMFLEWTVPDGMRLYLMVHMQDGAPTCADQFLVAVDGSNRTYRLPTTNCYENCKLCTGQFNGRGITYADALSKAWKQLEDSDWQSDLSNHGGERGMENSKNMFRFKPLEPDGFQQMSIHSDSWELLCTKISMEFINSFIVL